MKRKEKENNSCQTNYRCGKGGILISHWALAKEVDKICSVYPWRHWEPWRQLEMAFVVTVETGTSHITFEVLNLESWNFASPTSVQCAPALLTVKPQLRPQNRTAGALRLARTWCRLENCRNVNVHDSSSSLVFIRFSLGQSHTGVCVWCRDWNDLTHTASKRMQLLWFSVRLGGNKRKKEKENIKCIVVKVR